MDEKVGEKINELIVHYSNRGDLATTMRMLYAIFRVTREGCDLSTEDVEGLNRIAVTFISRQLRAVLFNHGLHVYAFQFAALHLIDINDVVQDMTNDGALKFAIPHGLFIKLRDELLKPMKEPATSSSQSTSIIKEQPTGKQNQESELDLKTSPPPAPPSPPAPTSSQATPAPPTSSFWQQLYSYWPWYVNLFFI